MRTLQSLKDKLNNTGVRIAKIDDDNNWTEIYFEVVDCVLMVKIGECVREFFKEKNRYTHLLPKFIGKMGCVVLVVSSDQFDKN